MHIIKLTIRIITLFFLLFSSALLAEYKQDEVAINNPSVEMTFVDASNIENVSNVTMVGVDQSTKHYHTDHSRCDLNKLNNVPNPVIYFQEREEESTAIHEALSKSNSKGVKLVCVVGFSGSGKTQLVIRYAHDYEEDYHHTRFFDASDKDKLLTSFKLFATNICHQDYHLCVGRQNREDGNCIVEIVKRCLKETAENFLWIFDNAKEYEEVKQYIPNEQNINGMVLLTTKSKNFAECDNSIDLSKGMKEDEANALLIKVITNTKHSDISNICSGEEIRNIATDIWGDLPLPISQAGEIIGRYGDLMEGCKGYLETVESDPQGIRNLIPSNKRQEEAILESMRFLSKLDLEIVGLLSFTEIPFPTDLMVVYIYNSDIGKSTLNLKFSDAIKDVKKIVVVDKILILKLINNINLIKEADGLLTFPHELFCEQVQRFLLGKDKTEPGSYKKLFDRATKFLCQNFSGHFWDSEKWLYEAGYLLGLVEQVVDNFIIKDYKPGSEGNLDDYKVVASEKLQPFSDSYLILANRLAKFYVQKDPLRAIKLFNSLLDIIENRCEIENNLSEYLKDSINHAAIMHDLVVAGSQVWFENKSGFDLNKAEIMAKSAYEIFEKELGKNDPRTLNAYLTLAHIKINLQSNKTNKSVIKCLQGELTIRAAIELSDLQLGVEDFNKFEKALSRFGDGLSDRDYSAIYSNVKKKMDI